MSNFDFSPKTIDDIVYRSDFERELIRDIANGSYPFPISGKTGILLHGTWGTGKTALAKLLPEAIERGRGGNDCHRKFVACRSGIEAVKTVNDIDHDAQLWTSNNSGLHYFIFDEVDLLTSSAMKSLKSVMNNRNTIFILTTNHLKKIDPGVRNRCIEVDCNAAPAVQWVPFVNLVITAMGAQAVPESALIPAIEQCNGAARDICATAINIARVRIKTKPLKLAA